MTGGLNRKNFKQTSVIGVCCNSFRFSSATTIDTLNVGEPTDIATVYGQLYAFIFVNLFICYSIWTAMTFLMS